MCQGNLVEINTEPAAMQFNTSTRSSLEDKPTIAYDPTALKLIYNQSYHDQRNMIMPFGCIRRVRELGINCKYSKYKPKCTIRPKTGVNFNNLIQVEINHKDGSIHDTQDMVCTVNVRSIKKKDQLLLRELNYHER